MKKAYVNLDYKDLRLSTYLIKVEYQDGESLENELERYNYSEVFKWIKSKHNNENDKGVKSIKIDLIR